MKDASSEMDQLVSYISKGIPEFIIDGLWACRSLEFRAEWEDNTIELISCLFLSILKVDLVTILVFIICGLQTTQAYRSLDFRVEQGNKTTNFYFLFCLCFALLVFQALHWMGLVTFPSSSKLSSAHYLQIFTKHLLWSRCIIK